MIQYRVSGLSGNTLDISFVPLTYIHQRQSLPSILTKKCIWTFVTHTHASPQGTREIHRERTHIHNWAMESWRV